MHAVAAFFASIITFVSGFFAPTVASNSPVDVRTTQPAAVVAAQTEIVGNPFNDAAAASAVAAAIPATVPASAFSPPPPQTVINQPVIERIIERIVPQGGAISAQTLAAVLIDFEQSISRRIAAINPPKVAIPEQVAAAGNSAGYYFAPASQRIDQITNTAINTPTITGGTISGASVSGYLPLSGGTLTGTLTGTDLNLSGVLTAGTLNVGGLSSSGALIAPYFTATSTTATSTFAGGLTAANGSFSILQNGNVGIGTAAPSIAGVNSNSRVLSIVGDGTLVNARGVLELANPRASGSLAANDTAGSAFFVMSNNSGSPYIAGVLGSLSGSGGANGFGGKLQFQTKADNNASSATTKMVLDQNGNVGIGTTTPGALLSAQGNILGAGTLALTGTTGTTTVASGQGFTIGGSQFVLQQGSGNVGIGTTSPASKLYIDGGTTGNNNLPFATIAGGGDSPTSVQLLLRNTREGAGAGGQDYENEVHLRLQAGTTNEHRAYINFANKDGVDQWLTGKNASNVWILYNSTDGHRLWMESTAGVAPLNTGNTYLNSSGSGSVQINNGNNDGDTFGTGGFEVFGGGTYPRTSLFKVSSLTATDAVLKATNNGSGYAPASLLLTATNANARGQGIFHYNTVSDTSWFTGVPYNVDGAKWMVGYESNATWDPAVAQTSKALFTIQNNGNVGIGTTSPTNKLEVAGNTFLGGTIVGTSTLALTGTTGTTTIALGQGFTIGGSQFVVQQGSGYVGIGTAGPNNRLEVSGGGLRVGGAASATATGVGAEIEWDGTVANFQGFNRAGAAWSPVAVKGSYMQLLTQGTERVRIDTTGNVGIGTTTPWGKLSITGSGTGTGLAFAVADSANTPRFVIQDNGNVGIGTTSPTAKLEIAGGASAGTLILNSNALDGSLYFGGPTGANSTYIYGYRNAGSAGRMDFYTDNTLRFRVMGDGKVAIGAINPASALDVSGGVSVGSYAGTNAAPSNGMIISGNVGIGTTTPNWKTTISNSSGPQIALTDGSLTSNQWTMRNAGGVLYIATSTYSATSSVSAFTLDANGNLTIVGSATTCTIGNGTSATSCSSSDQRLKDDITTLNATSGLAAVLALNPVSFHWNSWMQSAGNASSTQFGLIAQQVQSVFPNLVQEDANTHYYKLDYQGLIAPMIKAIQEIGSISGAFKTNLVAWLGDASNGIGDLFAKDIYATNGTFNRVIAQALCAEDICVTRDQLAAVLALIGQSADSSSANTTAGTSQAPVIEINGNASSMIPIGTTYADLGARITGPQSDLNLGITTLLDGATTTEISIDTSIAGTHTILYTVTSPTSGLTGSATRIIIVSPAEQPAEPPANDNPFNLAPANDNASSTTAVYTAA